MSQEGPDTQCKLCGRYIKRGRAVEHMKTAHTESEVGMAVFEGQKEGLSKLDRAKLAKETWLRFRTSPDTVSVHSIDEALNSAALWRLWFDANECNYAGCNHGDTHHTASAQNVL